ncbi:hypothetical protein DFQ28_007346 [Apophysomyces sp. BC1034]|nr:hypothetical protein DFQ28_007346 [Apophysomyces sp. BC1034]
MTVSNSDLGNLTEPVAKTAVPPSIPIDDLIRETLMESKEAFEDPYVFSRPIRRVAVIGSGPSGVSIYRGMEVRVFERNPEVGGTWLYNDVSPAKPSVPSNRFSSTETSPPVPENGVLEEEVDLTPEMERWLVKEYPPSACYFGLHCNTGTPILQLEDFPWPEDTPPFVSHADVCNYLKSYAEKFGLYPLIEFNTSVKQICKNQDGSWSVTLTKVERFDQKVRIKRWKESFDAVAVASGAHQDPYIPDFKGLKEYNALWPEKVMHSKQFRHPRTFKDKNVVIVGGRVSAVDISRHLNGITRNVYLSFRGSFECSSQVINSFRSAIPEGVIHKSGIQSFTNKDGKVDGTITLEDGTTLDDIDQVILCTGYMVDLPFLGDLRVHTDDAEPSTMSQNTVRADGKRAIDTYREIFHIGDPTLAFVGFPSHLTLMRFFSYQSNAVARVWEGTARLPNQTKMKSITEQRQAPCNPDDLTGDSERLRAQGIITWLNHHAEFNDVKDLKTLKNYDPEFSSIWLPLFMRWKEDSEKTIAETKEKELMHCA